RKVLVTQRSVACEVKSLACIERSVACEVKSLACIEVALLYVSFYAIGRCWISENVVFLKCKNDDLNPQKCLEKVRKVLVTQRSVACEVKSLACIEAIERKVHSNDLATLTRQARPSPGRTGNTLEMIPTVEVILINGILLLEEIVLETKAAPTTSKNHMVDPFTPRISNFKSSRKTRMPNNVKTYDGIGDSEDHVKNFQAATQVECWAMPRWCHMFNSTLIGTARVWFDELSPESINGYTDLKAAFLTYFMQQKKYVKDPVEIHNIKQKDGETIEEFMERFKIETGRMKGAPECMRIFEFMHGVNKHELVKLLNEHVPKTLKEMTTATAAFIRGETVAASKKKVHTPWKSQDQPKRQNSERRSYFRSQPRDGRGSNKFTPLTRTPKEIFTAGSENFKPPPPMVTPVEKRSSNKFYESHNDKGHNTNECVQLRKQIKELVRARKLSHFIKEIRRDKDQQKTRQKDASVKDKAAAIYMIQPWQRVTRQKVTQSFAHVKEITFLPLAAHKGTGGPLVVEAEISGHVVHRIYVDGGSSMEYDFNDRKRHSPDTGLFCEPSTANSRAKLYPNVKASPGASLRSQKITHILPGTSHRDHHRPTHQAGDVMSRRGRAIAKIEHHARGAQYHIQTADICERRWADTNKPRRNGVYLRAKVLVEVLKEKSIQEEKVATVVEEEGPTWMTPIMEYLKDGTLPSDRKEARKLRIKARQYELWEWVLLQAVIPKAVAKVCWTTLKIRMPTYRTTVVDAVQNNQEILLNLDLLEERRECVTIREAKAKLKMTNYYNTWVRGVTFRPGDFVYRSNEASNAMDGGKLGSKWEGPYEVTEALGDGAYRLRSMDGAVRGTSPISRNAISEKRHGRIRTTIRTRNNVFHVFVHFCFLGMNKTPLGLANPPPFL
nr:reverse transcriptase domain-containing protein [Tanacetum cinerariifolium]